MSHIVVWFHLNWLQESLFWLVKDILKIALRVFSSFLIYILYPVDLVKLWLMKVWKLGKKKNRLTPVPAEKGAAEPVVAGFLLVTSGAKSNELDSNRGSKCFGCLVSTEAHGDDGCQVLLREALCGRGPRARATAWQHQRGSEICSQSHRGEHEEWTRHTDRGLAFWQTSRCTTHQGLPYGSWSNSWQHRFQCCQCSTLLFCRPPAGIPFHTTGTQWSHQGLELRVRWEEKKGFMKSAFRCVRLRHIGKVQ